MVKYRVTHTTAYDYSEPASLSYNEARLVPRSFETPLLTQQRLRYDLEVDPKWRDYRERTDCFGNHVLYFTMRRPHDHMSITVHSEIELTPKRAAKQHWTEWLAHLSDQNLPWEAARERLQNHADPDLLELRQFMLESPLVPLFEGAADYAAESFVPKRPLLEATYELMTRIFTDFEYQPGVTTITTPLKQVYEEKSGVCQDFAQFMLSCLRSHGLAARYVSGYIETDPRPGEEGLQGSAASHAWVAVFVPKLGWVDFDPTNNLVPYDQHLTLSWGRDFSDVSPLKGILYGSGESELKVGVRVERVLEEKSEETVPQDMAA